MLLNFHKTTIEFKLLPFQGHPGAQGERGIKGERGTSGHDGRPGLPGANGRPAEKGEKGIIVPLQNKHYSINTPQFICN